MKISEIITDKYKLRMPPTVYYELLADVLEAEDEQEHCEDAISRQAVLDGLASIAKAKAKSDAQKSLMGRVMFFVEQLPPVTPQPKMGRWIPVSERLPKPYEQVLRTVKSIGWNGTFHIHVDLGSICPIDTDVIAWMPLPKQYKPQESEETE